MNGTALSRRHRAVARRARATAKLDL